MDIGNFTPGDKVVPGHVHHKHIRPGAEGRGFHPVLGEDIDAAVGRKTKIHKGSGIPRPKGSAEDQGYYDKNSFFFHRLLLF
jgi:hypothetical protein